MISIDKNNQKGNIMIKKFDINKYLEQHKTITQLTKVTFRDLAPRIVCKDGFNISVQVGRSMYCQPRIDDAYFYTHVEAGFPSATDDLITKYAEGDGGDTKLTQDVYPYTPVEVINDLIDKHGGLA